MGEITLVRHGQANSEAMDEVSYDRLSELGHQQAGWVGEWLRSTGERFDHVVAGTLRRHRETAEAMQVTPTEDARLNELDYYTLGHALTEAKGVPFPHPDGFVPHAELMFAAWQAGEIEGQESFAAFETRVAAFVADAARPGVHTLAVTSGGVIGFAMRHVLGLRLNPMVRLLAPIMNTSIHRFHVAEDHMLLAGFNAVPHLDAPERHHARTFF